MAKEVAEVAEVEQAVEPDPIRARKRAELEAQSHSEQSESQAALARVSPRAVIGTPQGRVVMGRKVRVACPLFPELTDPDGTFHPQLYVDFRTDLRQKELMKQVVLEALLAIQRIEGEPDEAYRQRRAEVVDTMSVQQWAKMVAIRAIGFEGWDLMKRNLDGTLEPIPMPNPLDVGSYLPLVENGSELQDLGIWILNEGFEEALEIGAKN